MSYITIKDDFAIDPSLLTIAPHYRDSVSHVLVSRGMILDRIDALAQVIVEEYSDKPLHLLCILTGGQAFFADLLTAVRNVYVARGVGAPITMDFLRVSSYQGTSSSGKVQISGEERLPRCKDRNVLVVEDLIDTGATMQYLLAQLKQYQPAEVRVASLFIKRTKLSSGYVPEYVGFSIPDAFIVGYCLDYNEHFRDMKHVCVINSHGVAKYKT